ncbi:MAG: molybdenum cofactor guanylyltransferase [Thermodesulfobacteriota bacterium]
MLDHTAGVILAGGKSSRFGSNKALADHDGAPLVQHIAERLAPLFSETLLVTNTPAEYDFLAWPTVADHFQECGPLAGIHAALSTIQASQAFVCGCDMPLVEPALIRLLCELSSGHDVVLPWLAAGPEPLYAVYAKAALPRIEASLAAGERKIVRVLARLRVRRVSETEILKVLPDLATFHNINHRHDLARLTELLA